MTAEEKLIGLGNTHSQPDGRTLLQAMGHPLFERAQLTNDWRNYIMPEVQQMWRELNFDARLLAYIMAETQANREDWE